MNNQIPYKHIEHNLPQRHERTFNQGKHTNLPIQNQYTDIEIPFGSKDRTIVPDAIKIVFNLDIESTDKARSIVNNVGRALVK